MNITVASATWRPSRLLQYPWHFIKHWGLYCAAAASVLAIVWQFGIRLPRHDDWILVESFGALRSVGLVESVLETHNVHPIPVPKAIIWVLWSLFGINAVSTTFLNLGLIILTGAVAMRTLRRDFSFPIDSYVFITAVFGPALPSLITWPTLVTFALLHSCIIALVAVIVRYGDNPKYWQYSVMPVILLLLAGCGIPGLIIASVVALTFAGLQYFRDYHETPRLRRVMVSLILIGMAVYVAFATAIVLGQVSEKGLANPGETFGSRIWLSVKVALEALANVLGDIGKLTYPVSSLTVLVAYVTTIYFLVRRKGAVPPSGRNLLLAALVGSYLVVAAVLGLGRSFQGGFSLWYFGLFATGWLPVFASWAVITQPSQRQTWGVLFLTLLVAVCPWMWGESIRAQREYRAAEKALLRDIEDGLPVSAIAARNGLGFSYRTIDTLRNCGAWPFRSIADDPPYQVIVLHPNSGELLNAERDRNGIVLHGPKSGISFTVPRAGRLALIRMKFDLVTPSRSNNFRLFLVKNETKCNPAAIDVIDKNAYFWKPNHRYGAELSFWIDGDIASVTILPSQHPGLFRLHTMELFFRR